MFKGIFVDMRLLETHRHAVYQGAPDTLAFLERAFRHTRVCFSNARFRPSQRGRLGQEAASPLNSDDLTFQCNLRTTGVMSEKGMPY